MIWLLNNWRRLFCWLLLLSVALAFTLSAHYHRQMQQAQRNASLALQEKRQAETITGNVLAAVTLFNEVARITHDEKQRNTAVSERLILYVRKAMQSDTCAGLPVPAAAADQLRQHRNKIRFYPASADTGRAAG